jgi:hypothetical protein
MCTVGPRGMQPPVPWVLSSVFISFFGYSCSSSCLFYNSAQFCASVGETHTHDHLSVQSGWEASKGDEFCGSLLARYSIDLQSRLMKQSAVVLHWVRVFLLLSS